MVLQIKASFKGLDRVNPMIDLFTMSQMTGWSTGSSFFRSDVGMGASAQDFEIPFIIFSSLPVHVLSEIGVNDFITGIFVMHQFHSYPQS